MIFFFAIFLFVSCDFQIPQNISVKTNASYNLSLGNFSKGFSQYLSADTVKYSIPKSEDVKFYVYDYHPKNSDATLQFLIDFKIKEIPIDVGSYMENMDFASEMKNTNINQEIDVPNLSVDTLDKEIDLPDFNQLISKNLDLDIPNLKIPEGINGTLPNQLGSTFHFTEPKFDTLEFYSGDFIITAAPTTTPSQDFHTNFTLQLLDENDGTVVGTVSNVDLSKEEPIKFPLTEKTIKKDMKLIATGESYGGKLGNIVEYELKGELSNDIKLHKAENLTISDADIGNPISINQTIYITTDESFVECGITDKSADEKSLISITTNSFPESWKGVKCEPTINISGGLSAQNSEFSPHGIQELPLNMELPLAGKVYKKGNIFVNGNLKIKIQNATIIFEKDKPLDKLILKTDCKIAKLDYMKLDLSKSNADFKADQTITEPLPKDVTDNVQKIQLKPSGMDVKYTNTLPEGNDIRIDVNSDFFNLHKNKATASDVKIIAGNTDKEEQVRGDNIEEKDLSKDENQNIEFDIKMHLPGEDSKNPNLITVKDIEIGKKYELKIDIKPVFDWEWAEVDLNKMGDDGKISSDEPINTGLNIRELFSEMTKQLGDDSFVDRLNFKTIPFYLYCVIPDVKKDDGSGSIFDSLNFLGNFSADFYVKDDNGEYVPKNDPEYIIGDENNPALIKPITKLPNLKLNTAESVTFDIENDADSNLNKGDLKRLFNKHSKGTLKMVYNFEISDEKGQNVVRIKKDMLNDADEDETLNIQIHARLLVPLHLEIIEDPENPNTPLPIHISKLINDGEDDIFGRDKGTDISDFEEYLDMVDFVKVNSKVTNNLFSYLQDEKYASILVKPNQPESEADEYKINFSKNGDFSVKASDFKIFLKAHPFLPSIDLILPIGSIDIIRDGGVDVNLSVGVRTDGTVEF